MGMNVLDSLIQNQIFGLSHVFLNSTDCAPQIQNPVLYQILAKGT